MIVRHALAALVVFALVATGCGDDGGSSSDVPSGSITVYSGRNEELIGELVTRFEESTGVDVSVRYGDSPALAATLREEGDNSPADVFFAQDPASLGAIAEEGMFARLPDDLLGLVPGEFSDRDGRWVGTSGRARTIVYDTSQLAPADLPADVQALTAPEWRGRLAIAPANGSFVAFVATMILTDGEEATAAWLAAVAANDPGTYSENSVIVAAVDGGEIEAGLVNHYYLLRREAEEGDVSAANHFFANGGPESLVMPAGAGVLATSDNEEAALAFIEFLLATESQQYFADETFEFPLIAGVDPDPRLPAISDLDPPDIDLSDLAGALDTATDLIADAGLL